jgi:steroid delta-isomerase-like uncharacterized protein
MEEANKALARRFYAELWNKGNFAAAPEFLHPDHFDHNPPLPGLPQGDEGVIQMIGTFRAAFPDLEMSVDEIIAEGDRVAERLTLRGTHTGTFQSIPATGRRISVTSVNVCRIEDGLVRERWGNADDVALMEQIGLFPARGSAAWRTTLAIAGAATRIRTNRKLQAGLALAGGSLAAAVVLSLARGR